MSMPESRTIPLLIKEQARRFASNEALIDGSRRYTYAQLLDDALHCHWKAFCCS